MSNIKISERLADRCLSTKRSNWEEGTNPTRWACDAMGVCFATVISSSNGDRKSSRPPLNRYMSALYSPCSRHTDFHHLHMHQPQRKHKLHTLTASLTWAAPSLIGDEVNLQYNATTKISFMISVCLLEANYKEKNVPGWNQGRLCPYAGHTAPLSPTTHADCSVAQVLA